MARSRVPPSVQALQQSVNPLGENIATDIHGNQVADQFYQGQEAKDFGNVQATAEDWRQHGAAIAPGDPQGFKTLMTAMHDRNAAFAPGTNFTTNLDTASPNNMPMSDGTHGGPGDVRQYDSALPQSVASLTRRVRR